MKEPRDPDTILAAWVDEGPNRLPANTRRAIVVATRTSRQNRPRTWVPWRISMPLFTKVAVAAVTVVFVGRLGLGLVDSVASPGSTPSPSPSASPRTPIDTSAWPAYVSDRYGFSIGHPADWTEEPAEHTWTLAEASVFPNKAEEALHSLDGHIRVSAWSVPIEPGTTVESWLGTYCPLNTTPCTGLEDRTIPITMDGHSGSLVQFSADTQAFIPVDDRMYVVAVWRPETDPLPDPYGRATRLLEGYLSTMHLLPGGPVTDTSAWTSYVSDRYGFSIGHPADWTEVPADHTWTMSEASVFPNSADEAFKAPGASVRASGWSVPVEPGTTVESWLETYCPLNTTPCTGLEARTIPVTVDGHPGSLVQFADDTQAFIPVNDRMYVVAVWEPNSDPRNAQYGGAVQLLKGYLSTMHLLPGGPAVEASPSPALSWTTDVSDRYGFEVGYPASWAQTSAERDWTYAADATDRSSPAMERFTSPNGDVRVSAWSVPLDPDAIPEALADFETWVQDYCAKTGTTPCTGIHERAVPLCLERRDCHPGLLVAFDDRVQAFVTAGIYPADKMIVVSVWSGETGPNVAPYGGARHLLEDFLSTMGVWPEAVEFGDRVVHAVPKPAG